MAPNLMQAVRQLAELEVDGEVDGMHKAQMESLSMIALNFLQSSCNAQTQHTRISTLETNFAKIGSLEESLKRAHSEISCLRKDLVEKDKALNSRIDTSNQQLTFTATTLRGEIAESAKATIGQMRKEMETMVESMSSAVTDLESSVKKVQKLATQNKDKIGVAVRKVEEIGESMSLLKKTTDRQIKELTVTMKEQMDHLVHNVNTFKKETQTKLKEAEEKFEAFRFETHQSMARKADIDDLAKKLNTVEHKQFVEKNNTEHETFATKQGELETNIGTANTDRAELRRDTASRMDTGTQERQQLMTMLTKLRSQIEGATSPAQLCAELKMSLMDHTEEMANQLRDEMKNALLECGLLKTPAMSTSKGNCFSCGKPMSNAFSPMPKRDPMSPKSKSPGGGFNSRKMSKRISVTRSRRSLDMGDMSPGKDHLLSPGMTHKRRASTGGFADIEREPIMEEKPAVKLPPIAQTDTTGEE